VQSIFGSWDKQFSMLMAGGNIKGYSFEVEDQPVPKQGKILLVTRLKDDLEQLGSGFFLDSRKEKVSADDWTAASRDLEDGDRKENKQSFKARSHLLARPVQEFVQAPGDPVWPGNYPTNVTLEVWDNTIDLGAEDAFGAIQRAIATWNNAGANYSLRWVTRAGGLTTSTSDARMVARWSPTGPPNVWATTTWLFNSANQFLDVDIQFWDNNAWSTAPAPGTVDVESVALHELGHFAGLPHSTGAADVMQPTIGAGVSRRILSNNDIAALQGLYGARRVGRGVVYRWWNGRDHFYTPQVYGELAPDAGYNFEGAPFVLFPGGTANTARFFRWFNSHSGDHFYTTNPDGELAPDSGYVYEGSIGNIATLQIAGTIPLFRWYHPRSGDHFYTTDPAGELAPASGYVAEGTAGFVAP